MCNITIYFCNIRMKHLQYTSKIIETYSCNMCFQCNISLLLGTMEARQCVVFTGGSGPVALVGGGSAAVVALALLCDLERAAVHRAWQAQQPSAATQM
jgi:hypothetical protein